MEKGGDKLSPRDGPYPELADPRYRSLDHWRGLACVMVVLVHAVTSAKIGNVAAERVAHPIAKTVISLCDAMGVGVPIFFVISGYCICATADSSRRKGHSFKDYVRRRFRRIYPPYWIALLCTAVIYAIAAQFPSMQWDKSRHFEYIALPWSLPLSQWLGNLTLTEMWRDHVLRADQPSFVYLAPAWTLCYEEQFYFVMGFLLFVMPRRIFAGAMGVTALVAIVFGAFVLLPGVNFKGFFFDGMWLMFGAGVMVYYYFNYSPPGGKWFLPLFLSVATIGAYLLARHEAKIEARMGARGLRPLVAGVGLFGSDHRAASI